MRTDVRELIEFSEALRDPIIDRAISNAFYNSLDDTIADGAREGHAFQNQTGTTEKSIYTEVNGIVGEVFVPVEPEADKVGVPYVVYLVDFDPFLDIAFDENIDKFFSQFERELFEEINEVY